MSEPADVSRMPAIEIATDDDLRRGLALALTKRGYGFNERVPSPDGPVYFEAWKLEDPENTLVIITMSAEPADKQRVATALALLGWYRDQYHKPHARAWVIAKAFTQEAWYAAQACPDLTLHWYRVELLIDLAPGYNVQR